MIVTKAHTDDEGALSIEATIPKDGRDKEIAEAFFADAERRGPIDNAVRDYERRIADDRPYEDAVSIDELARYLGR